MFDVIRPHRRRGARRAFSTRCTAVRMDNLERVGRQILDLSPRGALIACDAQVTRDETLLVGFRAPWLGPHTVVRARVCRIVEGWRAGDPGYCAGVRFLELEAEVRRDLHERLAHLPLMLPARRYPRDYADSVQRVAAGYE